MTTTVLAMALLAGTEAAPADGRLAEWLDAQWAARKPRPAERRLDEIGWATDVHKARRLSKESGRPAMVFTMDGRFQIGRC